MLGWVAALTLQGQVLLSEFQAANTRTLHDEDGDSEDWIEICNPGQTPVELGGWYLTDNAVQLTKWRFPATNLAPDKFLIVFASNKDRRIAGRPLHTNFRLSAEGEYLALVKPDGVTVATEYAPSFPPQANDISYGLPTVAQPVPLLVAGAAAKLLVPRDGMLGTNWVVPDFDDAAWTGVTNGMDLDAFRLGVNASAYLRLAFLVTNLAGLDELRLRLRYDDGFVAYLNGAVVALRNASVAAAGGVQADSLADWSAIGQQGSHNWYYGIYDQAGDADGTYDPFTDFENTDPQWGWNGGAWVLGPSNPPWDMIAAGSWHPNGDNNGGVHWVIRRWISQTSGTITCRIAFAKENTACGNGTTLHVLRNGVECFSRTIAYNDSTGIQTDLVLRDIQAGDLLDFALDPLGADGASSDGCDGSTFSVIIEQSPAAGLEWNSGATAARTPAETSVFEGFDLTRYRDFLVAGTNVLAIHALSVTAEDPGFLFAAELTGTWQEPSLRERVYFTTPSPGAANGPGATDVGPIISDVFHTPLIPDDTEDLVVQARVTPTFRALGLVVLTYRVMYGAEVSVAMDAGGADGDPRFAARIPASASRSGQMVRYYVVATDANGRQTRSPAYSDPKQSPQYYGTVVTDLALTNSRLPVLHWFIQNPGAANSGAIARCSLFFEGEFYDNIGANLHGQSTREFPKKSYDFDFNPGGKFRWSPDAPRVDDLHLLTTWADKTCMRNVLAHETYRDAGAPGHFAFAVRVQQNGAFFSVANVVENGDDYFLERLGLDPDGALYKMYNSAEDTSGAEKKTRKNEDRTDLQAVITGMSQANVPARQAFMFDHLDLPEVIDFLAAKMITADVDCCHKNYYLYRDTNGTGEWQVMPWDVDLCFGRVWTCGSPCLNYFDQTIYTNQSIFVGYGNRVLTPVYDTPATRQMFLRRLRTLMDTLFQAPGTPAAEDFYRRKTLALRDQIAPDAALDLAKWGTWGNRETITQAVNRIWDEFLPGRRAFLFWQMSVTNRGEIPLSQPTDVTIAIGELEFRAATGNPQEEWLSLTNANGYAVDISGWRLDGGVRFTFKPGTVIPGHAVLFVSPDVRAFRARTTSPKGGERRLVVGPYEGNLSAWGESVILADLTGRLVSSNAFTGDPSLAQRYLRVTEIMYNPAPMVGNTNVDAQLFEFLELRNIGPVALDLRGARLTEGVSFDFGSGAITNLAPGERLLVVRDTNVFTVRYGAALHIAGQFIGNLDNAGERLRIEDQFGEKILDFAYDPKWYPITDGHGFSLAIVDDSLAWSLWGEQSAWRPNGVLGGTPGVADPQLPDVPPIVINEILAHTDPPLSDTIELYNPTDADVDVGGWYLTDDFKVARKYRIPSPTVIPSGGFICFTESQFNPTPGTFPSFALNSEGDDIWLFNADAASNLTGYASGVEFGATANGFSLGRYTNSVGEVDYPAQTAVTPGRPNAGPLVGPVVISEIMYHPADLGLTSSPGSYVELANRTATNVPLYNPAEPTNTWRLRNAVEFDFPTGVVVPPNGNLLVVGFDPEGDAAALAAFRTRYGVDPGVPLYGPWRGRLGNSGETIELKRPDPWGTNGVPYITVEKTRYLDHAPWPVIADGSGAALLRRTLSAYANEPTNWFASAPSPGAPNDSNQPPAARDDGFAAPQALLTAIAVSSLLANDTDPDGDSLTLSGVSPSSDHGAALSLAGGHVFYHPLPEFQGDDLFTYTIADSHGLSATGRVAVLVYSGSLPGPNHLIIALSSEGCHLRYAGTPGRACELQRSADLVQWTTLVSTPVPAHGYVEYLDNRPLTGGAYYRAAQK